MGHNLSPHLMPGFFTYLFNCSVLSHLRIFKLLLKHPVQIPAFYIFPSKTVANQDIYLHAPSAHTYALHFHFKLDSVPAFLALTQNCDSRHNCTKIFKSFSAMMHPSCAPSPSVLLSAAPLVLLI